MGISIRANQINIISLILTSNQERGLVCLPRTRVIHMYSLNVDNNKVDSDISLCLTSLVGFLVLWLGVYIVMS